MKRVLGSILLIWLSCASVFAARQPESHSVYTLRPEDPEAIYFTPENYGFRADGKSDVTAALQQAINDVKTRYAFGIIYLPEGEYRITKTVTIPANVRLIGYGKKRPVIYLADNTPGFQDQRNYMIWFTGGLAREGMQPSDANAGTFYSALSNVDFRIGKGNPQAVAVRSHFAQHGFLSHIDFQIRTNSDHLMLDMLRSTDYCNIGSYWLRENRRASETCRALIEGFEGRVAFGCLSIDNRPLRSPAAAFLERLRKEIG